MCRNKACNHIAAGHYGNTGTCVQDKCPCLHFQDIEKEEKKWYAGDGEWTTDLPFTEDDVLDLVDFLQEVT